MQDSNITFKVTTVGIEEATAKMDSLGATITKLTYNANGTVTASGKLSSTLDEQSKNTDKVTAATDRASKSQGNYFVHIAKTTVQSALVNKAFLGFVQAASDAVKQVDLFSNFPASMAALGLSASDATASLGVLRDYIAKVGGNLTTATTSVARFAEVTKNVKAATAEFVGVNNALIAGGAGADVQANALEQLTQAYSRGKPQLIEWRSLMVAMPAQLNQVAKAMNEPNAQALGEALTQGKVSMQSFLTELTKLSTGTGPIANQAIARMQGIQFAANVMKNALTNGLAAIYQAVGRQNIIGFFNFLTEVIIVLSQWVVILINNLISLFNWLSKAFGGPQISHFSGEAQGAADALGAGAANAGDMADGLDSAADSAAKINKSLASFDKMNVLPDKTSSSGDNGNGITGPLDTATAAQLDNIFGDIKGKVQEISGWAKILAGVLTGLAANALIGKIFGVTPLELFAAGIGKFIVKPLAKQVVSAAASAAKAIGNFGIGLLNLGQEGEITAAEAFGLRVGLAIRNGMALAAAGISAVLDGAFVLILGALATLGEAVAAIFIGAAAAAALPFAAVVAIGAVIVAAIIALGIIIFKNWDKIWGLIRNVASTSWKFIQKLWNGAVNFFVGIWKGIYNAFAAVGNAIKNGFQAIVTFVQTHAQLFEIIFSPLIIAVAAVIIIFTGLVKVFQFVWDGITAIFAAAPNFFGTIFQAAWDAITLVWSVVVAFFQAIWNGIVAIFTAAVQFYAGIFKAAWDAIVAVWGVVAAWFNNNVIQPVIALFTPLATFIGNTFADVWNGIKVVWSVAAGFFGGVWNGIKAVFGNVASFLGDAFRSAYNTITGVFGNLWAWFRDNVWAKLVSIFTTVGTTIGNAISGAFKGIVNAVLSGLGGVWNTFVDILNHAIDVVKTVPGTGFLQHVNKWNVPQLAKGGIIDQPTLAMVGESGKEAIMPLENNTDWIDTLASKLNGKQNNGQPVQLVVQIGEDKIVSKVIELINEKTIMSGRNAILV